MNASLLRKPSQDLRFNAQDAFDAMIGRHLGNDLNAYRSFLSEMERHLSNGANPNVAHKSSRLADSLHLWSCPANGFNTAVDLYQTLSKMYEAQAKLDVGGEEVSCFDEGISTFRAKFCGEVLALLQKFGARSGQCLFLLSLPSNEKFKQALTDRA